MKIVRHFLDLIEVPAADLRGMIEAARAIKLRRDRGERPLAGKTLAMIFERPSTRTRVSFEVAMRQLGGDAILLTAEEMQLGRGETLADTARVLSRYVDAIMIRMLDPEAVSELAHYAAIPVINGLTRRSHPCQVLADVMTFEESRGPIRGRGCMRRSALISICGWRRRPNWRQRNRCSIGSRPPASRSRSAPTRKRR